MSVTSARVGRGLLIIVCNIWVATITGFFFKIHLLIMLRWIPGICSIGTSIPKSPRAIIIPYEASIISSILSTPSWFSIFEIILISELCSSRIFWTARTSAAERTKEWAMKSISSSIANKILALSFSVSAGSSICSPGTFTLLREPSSPSFCTCATNIGPTLSIISISNAPSSKRTWSPTFTSRAKSG